MFYAIPNTQLTHFTCVIFAIKRNEADDMCLDVVINRYLPCNTQIHYTTAFCKQRITYVNIRYNRYFFIVTLYHRIVSRSKIIQRDPENPRDQSGCKTKHQNRAGFRKRCTVCPWRATRKYLNMLGSSAHDMSSLGHETFSTNHFRSTHVIACPAVGDRPETHTYAGTGSPNYAATKETHLRNFQKYYPQERREHKESLAPGTHSWLGVNAKSCSNSFPRNPGQAPVSNNVGPLARQTRKRRRRQSRELNVVSGRGTCEHSFYEQRRKPSPRNPENDTKSASARRRPASVPNLNSPQTVSWWT